MKKLISTVFSVALICSLLAGCNSNTTPVSNEKYNIICTIYPQYDWVMQLLGDNADNYNVTLLTGNGTDMHNYQPTARDIITISTCDLFIYVGGESDKWVQDIIEDANNKDMISLNMLELLGDRALKEEIVDGMEHEHDSLLPEPEKDDSSEERDSLETNDEHKHNSDHESLESNEEHEHDETSYDEHVWLSLTNAKIICEAISAELCKLDFDNSSDYQKSLETYAEKLDFIDQKYRDTISSAKRNTLLFGDRFPFRYLAEDYKLDYYAAFPGCNADTEASFKTIIYLAEKTDELNLPVLCVTESSDKAVASTIIDNTTSPDRKILTLNSLQSVTNENIKEGISYIQIMESNLETLKIALN